MDPYQTLDVPKDATEAEIKAAYRQKATEHHPDQGGDCNFRTQVKEFTGSF